MTTRATMRAILTGGDRNVPFASNRDTNAPCTYAITHFCTAPLTHRDTTWHVFTNTLTHTRLSAPPNPAAKETRAITKSETMRRYGETRTPRSAVTNITLPQIYSLLDSQSCIVFARTPLPIGGDPGLLLASNVPCTCATTHFHTAPLSYPNTTWHVSTKTLTHTNLSVPPKPAAEETETVTKTKTKAVSRYEETCTPRSAGTDIPPLSLTLSL